MDYTVVKWLHILSSTLLFGTGIGSAYYLLRATMTRDPAVAAAVARMVVSADWLFTAVTVVAQPLTGLWLAHLAGFPRNSGWLQWTYALYALAIGCWLVVLRIQIAMRNEAQAAVRLRSNLSARYWRLFRLWFALGIPAFVAFLIIFYLMAAKPS